jgi:hypothetical protein
MQKFVPNKLYIFASEFSFYVVVFFYSDALPSLLADVFRHFLLKIGMEYTKYKIHVLLSFLGLFLIRNTHNSVFVCSVHDFWANRNYL